MLGLMSAAGRGAGIARAQPGSSAPYACGLRSLAGQHCAGTPKEIRLFIEQDPRLDQNDQATLQDFFVFVGIVTFSELADLANFEPLDAYLRTQMERFEAQAGAVSPAIRIALGRIIKAARDVTQQPAAAPEPELHADSGTRDLLAGMLADKGEAGSLQRLLTAKKRKSTCVSSSMRLITMQALTSDEDLKKIGVATELGYAMPPYVCAFPDPSKPNEYLFPDLTAALGRFAHGGLLHWRHDPATVINMFTDAAAIASDRTLGSAGRAARVSAEYLEKCREQLFAWSRSHPQDDSAANDAFAAQVTKQYIGRDTQCYQDALQAIDAKPSRDRPKTIRSNSSNDQVQVPPPCTAYLTH